MINRRKFFRQSAAAFTGAALTGFNHQGLASSLNKEEKFLSFDLHTHPGLFPTRGLPRFKGDEGILNTINEMNTGGLTGGFFSLVADLPVIQAGPDGVKIIKKLAPGEAWIEYNRQIAILKDLSKSMPFTIATKAKDLDHALTKKKVACYIACEGGDFLEGKAERLEKMYNDGVRSVQLVHYNPNELGNLQTDQPRYDGLSTEGKEIVKAMNKLKMIVDVAHATYDTTKAVADITTAPIILSHSVLEMGNDRPISQRAISIEHAKVVAKTGGVIGAWPSGFNKSFDEFVDNTLRMIDAIGIDHVGLGTDMDGNFKPVFTSYTQLPSWIEALKAKGLITEEVKKVTGGNCKRILSRVL